MLKFNKKHELQELEKYGFEQTIEYSYMKRIETCGAITEYFVDIDEYAINITMENKFKDDNQTYVENELDLLYDLIKDGLIIKE